MSSTKAAPVAPAATIEGRRAGRAAQRLFLARELGIGLALALLLAVTAAVNPGFLSAQSLRDLLLGAAILVILAVGQTLVIVTRNVDLSVGSVLGLTAFAVGKLLLAAPGTAVPLVVLTAVGLGAVCGAVNGALVAAARVPSLVITLGTLYVFRGVDFSWASGQQINAADMPRSFLQLGTATLLGIPDLALVAAAVTGLAGAYLHGYRSGRELYAIGSEPAAARLSGVPVGRRVFAVFVASVPSPAWPVRCTLRGSAPSTPPPAPASSCRSWPPPWSEGSPSSAVAAASMARPSGPCSLPPSAARWRSCASTRSGSRRLSAR